jgi:RNA polymerase sigma-70 factor (ECF subfamily)
VALTLRTVAGLTTIEIARAFLVAEATMSKRLVRARAKIRDAEIPYRVPPPELISERTDGILPDDKQLIPVEVPHLGLSLLSAR